MAGEVTVFALSLPLGAGRLTREFLPDDVPSPRQLKALRRHVNATLQEISDRLRWEGPPDKAVATSKTFKQLARLAGAAPQMAKRTEEVSGFTAGGSPPQTIWKPGIRLLSRHCAGSSFGGASKSHTSSPGETIAVSAATASAE